MNEELQKTNGAGDGPDPEVQALHRTFKALEADIFMARSMFMRQAGISFDGARDTYQILGYDRALTLGQFREEYARGGLAGRIVDVMPDATWRGMPAFEIIEDEELEDYTPFEQAWVDLEQKHQITSKFQRVDKLARLSTFAVLLIGATGNLEEELPKSANGSGLLYFRAISGGGGPDSFSPARTSTINDIGDCAIKEYDADPRSERYGLPLFYTLRTTADLAKSLTRRDVHWSRVTHNAEGLLENEVFGLPALERVWNLLQDLHKVTGGGAEAFWLRANQGLHMDIDKDMEQRTATGASDLATVIANLKEQAVAYKHQMDRWIRTKGVKVSTLGSDVADFGNPADAIITQIAGAKGIPKRILTGSEMGELASSQDRENFRDQIVGRQTQYAGPYIVRPLVDRLITYGYLPTPKKGLQFYDVKWPHIQVMTEAEKADGMNKWMAANQAAKNAGLQPVVTEAEARDHWYGMGPMTEEQLQAIEDAKRAAMELAQEMAPSAPVAAGKFPRAASASDNIGTFISLKLKNDDDRAPYLESPRLTSGRAVIEFIDKHPEVNNWRVNGTVAAQKDSPWHGEGKRTHRYFQDSISTKQLKEHLELAGHVWDESKHPRDDQGRFTEASYEDAELIRVLAEAIEAGNAEVVEQIIGLKPTEPADA